MQMDTEKIKSFFASVKKVEVRESVLALDGKSYYRLRLTLQVAKKKQVKISIGYSGYGFEEAIFDDELQEEIRKDMVGFFVLLVDYLKDDMLKGNLERLQNKAPDSYERIWLKDNLRDIKGYKVDKISFFLNPTLYLENGDKLSVGFNEFSPGNTDITRIELLEYAIREIEERNLNIETLPYLKKELTCYKAQK